MADSDKSALLAEGAHGPRLFLVVALVPAAFIAPMGRRAPMIAVCGGGTADDATAALAEAVGYELARASAVVVCGGLGGVMEHACAGAKRGGGLTVGIVPGTQTRDANRFVDVPIASGMAVGRNAVIVQTADAVIALPGSYGTLSEIALALQAGKPVATIGTWCPIPGVIVYQTALEAVRETLRAIHAVGQ